MPTVVTLRSQVPGAVSASVAGIGARSVVAVEFDATDKRGALSQDDGETIAAAARLAWQQQLPLVASIASSGADVEEGVSALVGWGTAARELVRCSGIVPIVLVVTGPAVSGPALLLGLADVVILTPEAYAFVSGPRMVTEFTGVPITPVQLGGAGPHSRSSGVAALVASSRDDARELVAILLSHLPDNADEEPPRISTADPADRGTPELASLVPTTSTGSYDVRAVARCIVDDGELLELRSSWAANLVTAFASVDGQPVGIVANQPQTLAGTLDIAASQKGARFVAFCDAFNVPLITMVDTPGFSPGKDQEWRGMIRHGAQLAFAYARATVPRICLTLRKSYGGAYIVMDSKTMGNDLSLAWPSAEIAVMGAKGAVEILMRRADPEERAAAEADYEERLLNPYLAAERGLLDAVIDPADTRREIAAALAVLATKRERLAPRPHDNTPL
ncbi:MAG TPA: carboxyl transferase domain-containing protein [Acidimicrobiales bacterium]|nr:carboxyl transferase domain-containing protein [Acidimicrobiales bacterium]